MASEDGDPDGPLWYTFTFPLPFTLGLDDRVRPVVYIGPLQPDASPSVWANPDDEQHFGPSAQIRCRFVVHRTSGLDLFPKAASDVIESLYGRPLDFRADQMPSYAGDGSAYEQWVSVETQGARLAMEDPEDRAYAFHRCVSALNQVIKAHIVAFGVDTVHPIRTEDIGAFMFRGAWDQADEWHFLNFFLMHPGNLGDFTPVIDLDAASDRIDMAVGYVFGEHPFVPSKLWYWRAKAAARRGDEVDRVVSLQTAMENLLYATWRMCLVDGGLTSEEIHEKTSGDAAFKTLINSVLPGFLGGNWSLTDIRQPSTRYWRDLYLLRNRIVHAGYEPSKNEGDAAEQAYLSMRTFVDVCVWNKRRTYPRTAMARVGRETSGRFYSKKFFNETGTIAAEPAHAWWKPRDERP